MLHSEATCIRTDHYGICKFGSESSPGFDVVCAVIQGFVNRSPVFISSQWKEEKRKMQLRNRNSALCKPLNADANPFMRSRRGSYERQEYRPIADSCDTQNPKSAATPIRVAENVFHTIPEASLGLVNEAGLEDFNYSQETSSNDPYRLPPQVASDMYGMAVKNLVSTSDARREITAPSGLDNGSFAAGKPPTITTRSSELQEPHRAFLPNKSQTVFTPIDENATLVGSHWSSESYEKYSRDGANTRPCDPHILTQDLARQSASVLARHAPASSSERASRLNNHPQGQPITFISGYGAYHESDTLAPDLQDLNPTQKEQANAKEEVLKLLRQWTTLDVSKFVENQNRGAGDVQVGAQAAAIVC